MALLRLKELPEGFLRRIALPLKTRLAVDKTAQNCCGGAPCDRRRRRASEFLVVDGVVRDGDEPELGVEPHRRGLPRDVRRFVKGGFFLALIVAIHPNDE